jgi:hypothetical protein
MGIGRKKKSSGRVARNASRSARMLAEMPAATAVTLAYRVPLLLAGAVDPRSRDDAELTRMVEEKVAAGRDTAAALARGGAAITTVISLAMRRQAGVQAKMIAAMFGVGSAKTSINGAIRNGHRSLARSNSLAFRISNIAERTTMESLRPSHRRVAGNARRLSKKSAK